MWIVLKTHTTRETIINIMMMMMMMMIMKRYDIRLDYRRYEHALHLAILYLFIFLLQQ